MDENLLIQKLTEHEQFKPAIRAVKDLSEKFRLPPFSKVRIAQVLADRVGDDRPITRMIQKVVSLAR